MTPNGLIRELQKYIEIAREDGWEIGDEEDAVAVHLRGDWKSRGIDYFTVENAELGHVDGPDGGPIIVLE